MKKLTKKQQLAVAIAKDVIKQIRARKLRVDKGDYCCGILEHQINPKDQVKKHLPSVRKNCDVCAKGAIFLSYIELKNKVTFAEGALHVDDYGRSHIQFGSDYICEILSGAFSKENFDLIEEAFEVWPSDDEGDESRAYKFGLKYKTSNRRLLAICENIIENKGEFVP